ncbi:MAG: hypothetical protein CVV28_05275 [Methanobacteriales archaeon HGW-Methanobacteriales-1]|jgi:hypothetical protein|nr:MAG: hypothetical protein CVV28_05275 [Methanobacteriales archaeon HGW-Methanobacteriales-1]
MVAVDEIVVISSNDESNLEIQKKEIEEEKTKLKEDRETLEKKKKEFEQETNNLLKYIRPATNLYLLAILLVFVWIVIDNYFSVNRPEIIQTIIYIACAGGIGGTLSAMTAISGHQKDFNPYLIIWYIYRPIGGIVLGVIVYFLLICNLFVLQLTPNAVNPSSVLAYSGIAFLAGFATKEVTVKLRELSKTLFSGNSDNSKNNGS